MNKKYFLRIIGLLVIIHISSFLILKSKYKFFICIEILKNFYIWLLGNQPLTSITILTTVATAFMSYKKYSFEKNRDLYIQKLQKVYAPLYSYVIKQETGRQVLWLNTSTEGKLRINFENIPIFELKQEVIKDAYTPNEQRKITSIFDWDQLSEIIEKESNYSFMSTNLINLLSQKSILSKVYEQSKNKDNDNDNDKKILNRKKEIEAEIIKDIFTEYRKCIRKLGVDDKKYILDLNNFPLDGLDE